MSTPPTMPTVRQVNHLEAWVQFMERKGLPAVLFSLRRDRVQTLALRPRHWLAP